MNDKNGIDFSKAFDLYCRHNEAKYPEIHYLRNSPHWFIVLNSKDEHEKSTIKKGDKLLVCDGYITNVSQGWTFDTLNSNDTRTHESHGTTWLQWANNRAVCFIDVMVMPIEGNYGLYV